MKYKKQCNSKDFNYLINDIDNVQVFFLNYYNFVFNFPQEYQQNILSERSFRPIHLNDIYLIIS